MPIKENVNLMDIIEEKKKETNKNNINLNGTRIRTASNDPVVTIRLPNEIRSAINIEAIKNGRSTRSEIAFRLAESIRNKEK